MSDSLHIVCPHCEAVNRLDAQRLQDKPVCGKCTRELFTGKPIELDSARLLKHIERNDIAVLVDFWAPWCGPCQMMAPAYQQAAQQLEPGIRLLKVNTENAPDLGTRYNIRSIPTLALFRNGREAARQAGAMDARGIVSWVEALTRTA
jgi:thioredoxin 2